MTKERFLVLAGTIVFLMDPKTGKIIDKELDEDFYEYKKSELGAEEKELSDPKQKEFAQKIIREEFKKESPSEKESIGSEKISIERKRLIERGIITKAVIT